MYSAHRPTAVSQSALALALLQGKYARLTLPQSWCRRPSASRCRSCTSTHCTARSSSSDSGIVHFTALTCTVQHSMSLICTAHCTLYVHCTLHAACCILHTTLHCTVLYCTALHCTALHCTAPPQHCTALQYTTVYYSTLHWHWHWHCPTAHCTLHIFCLQAGDGLWGKNQVCCAVPDDSAMSQRTEVRTDRITCTSSTLLVQGYAALDHVQYTMRNARCST